MMYEKLEIFKSYFQNASEKQTIVDMLAHRFYPSAGCRKILDLGCHEGSLMQNIMQQYHDRLHQEIDLIGVDPAEAAVNIFAQRDYGAKIKPQKFAGSAESYFTNHATFHEWIIASQCLYWSHDLCAILNMIHASSHSSLIVLRGRRGIYEIQSSFQHLLGNQDEQLYVADDIEVALIRSRIPFQRENIHSQIALPKDDICYQWLINFFLQTDENKMTIENYAEVRQFIATKLNNPIHHDVSLFWLGGAMI